MKKWVLGFLALVVLGSSAQGVTVRSGHPRLMFYEDSLAVYKPRLQVLTPWYTDFNNEAVVRAGVRNPSAYIGITTVSCVAMIEQGAATTPTTLTNQAVAYIRYHLHNRYQQLNNSNTPARLDAFIFAYDWLYDFYPQSTLDSLEAHILWYTEERKDDWWQNEWDPSHVQAEVIPSAYVLWGETLATPAQKDTVTAIFDRGVNYFDDYLYPCFNELDFMYAGPLMYFGVFFPIHAIISEIFLLGTDQPSVVTKRSVDFQNLCRYWSHQMRPDGAPRCTVHRYNPADWTVPSCLGFLGVRFNDALDRYMMDYAYQNFLKNGSDFSNPIHTYTAAYYIPNMTKTTVAAPQWSTKFGHHFYRSNWDLTTSPIMYGFYCGPEVTSSGDNGFRSQLNLTVGRGNDVLLFNNAHNYSASESPFIVSYADKTIGHNSILVFDPTETLVPDGGQEPTVWADYGDSCWWIGTRGLSDSLQVSSARVWGAIGDATEDYSSSKVSAVLRRVVAPRSDWLVVQDYVNVVGPKNLSVVWHCNQKPVNNGTHTQLVGNTYGGIWTSTDVTYEQITQGSSRCILYPRWPSSRVWSIRTIGGSNSANLPWRQHVTSGMLTYVPTDAEQAYECYQESNTKNYSPTTTGLSQAQIDARWVGAGPTGDWRLEWRFNDANGNYHIQTLIQTGANTITPRNVVSTNDKTGFYHNITDTTPPMFVYDPYLSTGLDQPTTNRVAFTVLTDGTVCYVYGLADGTYNICKSGVPVGTFTPVDGAGTFTATTAGSYVVSLTSCSGIPDPGACCDIITGACFVSIEAECVGATQEWVPYVTCSPNPCTPATGACCRPTGVCLVRTSAQCASLGTWLGPNTTCTPNPCTQPTGRCCYPDGTCAVLLQSECTGTWGMNQPCDPNPCVQPSAACCFLSGACSFVPLVTCTANGGTWLGYPTVCSPNPCDQPSGSCCYPNGVCAVTTQAECSETWTQGESCTPNPCDQPNGACCASDGTCSFVLESACVGATWLGYGSACSPNPCTQPTGSCCTALGACSVTLEANCVDTWTMFEDCDPNPCAQPTGACCVHGVCSLVEEASCSGSWLGALTDCDPNPCPAPVGACCYDDGSCVEMVESTCAGTLWTDGGVCLPNPCTQPTGACCHSDGTCTERTLEACDGQWIGFESDCDPNPCDQPPSPGPGVCCLDDGACFLTLQTDCPGRWHGQEATCDPNPCWQPPSVVNRGSRRPGGASGTGPSEIRRK